MNLGSRGGSFIVGVRRPDGSFQPQPPAELVLEPGDVVMAMGTPRTMDRLRELRHRDADVRRLVHLPGRAVHQREQHVVTRLPEPRAPVGVPLERQTPAAAEAVEVGHGAVEADDAGVEQRAGPRQPVLGEVAGVHAQDAGEPLELLGGGRRPGPG